MYAVSVWWTVMIIVDELVKCINICLHPSKNTKEKQSLGQAIGFYYKFALIPIIISLIVQIVFPLPAIFSFSTSISLVGSYIIGFPFEILVVAGFIYLFGSVLFHKFKGNFEATFVSVLYGYIPMILLYWLILLIASSFAFVSCCSNYCMRLFLPGKPLNIDGDYLQWREVVFTASSGITR